MNSIKLYFIPDTSFTLCHSRFLIPHECNPVNSKHRGQNLTRKGSIWGQAPFRVNDDPEISQLDAEYDPMLGQSDPIVCLVCRKLTDFRVIVDPEWSLAPTDPFPGHVDPGVFRVYSRYLTYVMSFPFSQSHYILFLILHSRYVIPIFPHDLSVDPNALSDDGHCDQQHTIPQTCEGSACTYRLRLTFREDDDSFDVELTAEVAPDTWTGVGFSSNGAMVSAQGVGLLCSGGRGGGDFPIKDCTIFA